MAQEENLKLELELVQERRAAVAPSLRRRSRGQQTPSRGSAAILAAASALARAPMLKLLGREPDCWRRTVGLGLRSEGTRFALGCFGLRIPPDSESMAAEGLVFSDTLERFVRQFARFAATEPDAHFALKHHPHHVERAARSHVDLVSCEYSPEGELVGITTHLDSRAPAALDYAAWCDVEKAILAAHRATRHLSDKGRPQELASEVRRRMNSAGGTRGGRRLIEYAMRILSACAISSEPMPAESRARFVPPDFRLHRGLGAGAFDVVVRPHADGAVDVWLNVHHAAADGAPMQEMLSRLERSWGGGNAVYPVPDAGQPWFTQSCQTAREDRPITLLVDFLDLTPLCDSRTALNVRLAARFGSPVPLAAMILWSLAKEPEFAGRRFSTAVDVPQDGRRARGVDLISIRPEDYFTEPDGFIAFAREYLACVNAGRRRSSPSFAAMRALSYVAPRYATKVLAANRDRRRATFGTVGLSLLKEAKVFVAPTADHGWEDGFLALGNAALPAGDGRTVGVLTVKAEPERVAECASAFRRALGRASGVFGEII